MIKYVDICDKFVGNCTGIFQHLICCNKAKIVAVNYVTFLARNEADALFA